MAELWAHSGGMECYYNCDGICEADEVNVTDKRSDEDIDVSDNGSDVYDYMIDDGSNTD